MVIIVDEIVTTKKETRTNWVSIPDNAHVPFTATAPITWCVIAATPSVSSQPLPFDYLFAIVTCVYAPICEWAPP